MDTAVAVSTLSWRDPDGYVVNLNGEILRAVAIEKAASTRTLLCAPWMIRLVDDGLIQRSEELSNPPPGVDQGTQWIWLRHEALAFPCYPHEITALQLYDSGQLTLKIAIEAAQHGYTLKDASASNVLFSRGRPLFVDVLSFEQTELTATWMAYGQFARNFLLPLLLHQKLGLTPADVFTANRDGISPEHAYQLLGGGLRRMSAVALEFVVLPKMLSRSGSRLIASQAGHKAPSANTEMGKELALNMLRRMQRKLERLRPDHSNVRSVWKRYEEERSHYSEADLAVKKEFVGKSLGDSRTVLDLGCNAGEFSFIAAERGMAVVAADGDHPALSRLYARVRDQAIPITPVLLNIGRPTPAVGWENREVASFIDRSVGEFDCILVLGLIHHLLVSERSTLPMLVDLLDRLDPKRVILEWVDPKDQKFQQLAGLNRELYSHLDADQLEASMGQKFRLVEKLPLPCGTRVMYLWCRLLQL